MRAVAHEVYNGPRIHPKAPIVRITLAKTVDLIVERSWVQWRVGSEGLGLILTPSGYELTSTPERFNGSALPDRVTIPARTARRYHTGIA